MKNRINLDMALPGTLRFVSDKQHGLLIPAQDVVMALEYYVEQDGATKEQLKRVINTLLAYMQEHSG